jgi:transposase-like protein
MGRQSKYGAELQERAVRMVAEIRPDYPSQWAAICEVAGKLGVGAPETVRSWVRRAEVDARSRPGMTTEHFKFTAPASRRRRAPPRPAPFRLCHPSFGW